MRMHRVFSPNLGRLLPLLAVAILVLSLAGNTGAQGPAMTTVNLPPGPPAPPPGSAAAAGPSYTPAEAVTYTVLREPAPDAPPNVLLICADSNPCEPLRTQLVAFGDLGTVASFDARSATPTLAQLQAYNAVVVWSNNTFYSASGLGDVLADYVDWGGRVVNVMFSIGTHGFALQGRFATQSYSAINGTSILYSGSNLGTFDPTHPIMQGVTAVYDYYRLSGTTLTAGATTVASWQDGTIFVAVKSNCKVASITGYPGQARQWTGQMDRVIHNAITWSCGKTWNGSVSSDWATAGNWTSSGAPVATDDAIIPAGTPNSPIIGAGTSAACKNITINAGATLSLASGAASLSVNGNWNNAGTVNGGAGSTVTFNAASSMSGGGANNLHHVAVANGINLNGGAQTINVAGDWTLGLGSTFTPGTSNVVMGGAIQSASGQGHLGPVDYLGPEAFEGSFPPSGWGIVTNAPDPWRGDDPFVRTNRTGSTGKFAIADSGGAVFSPQVLIFKDVNPWSSTAEESYLASLGIPYVVQGSSAFASTTFEDYGMIIICGDQTTAFYTAYGNYRTKFESYVSVGGFLMFVASDGGWNSGHLTAPMPGGMTYTGWNYDNYNVVVNSSHPTMNRVQVVSNPFYGNYASHGYFSNLPGGAITAAQKQTGGQPTVVEYSIGAGKVIALTQPLEHGYVNNSESGKIFRNAIVWGYDYNNALGHQVPPPTDQASDEPAAPDDSAPCSAYQQPGNAPVAPESVPAETAPSVEGAPLQGGTPVVGASSEEVRAGDEPPNIQANTILHIYTTDTTNSVRRALNELGYTYDTYSGSTWTGINFAPYTTVIIGMDGGTVDVASVQKLRTDVIDQGKRLIVMGGSCYLTWVQGINSYLVLNNTSNYCWTISTTPHWTKINTVHPLSTGLPDSYNFVNSSAAYYQLRITDANVTNIARNGDGYNIFFYKNSSWPGGGSPTGDLCWFTATTASGYWGNANDYAVLKQMVNNCMTYTPVCYPLEDGDFTWTPPIPQMGQNVSFAGTVTPPTATMPLYSWTFGDGTTGSGANPTHAYGATGTYTVTMNVTNCATPTVTAQHTITVICNEAVSADFTWTPTPPHVGQSVSFMGSVNPPTTTLPVYSWTFGDGTTGSGQNPSHTYGASGTYNVVLTVSYCNGAGQVTVTHQVTVMCDPVVSADFTWTPLNPRINQVISFVGSITPPTATLPVYSWNFGDGTTGSGPNPTHSYPTVGTYDVVLTVSYCNGEGLVTVTHQVVVTCDPVTGPNFTWTPLNPRINQVISFAGSVGGGTAPFTYAWNFGDGTTGSGQNVTHSYPTVGSYVVRLTVTNCNGASSAYIEYTVVVTCDPVINPNFTWTPPNPYINVAVSFAGSVGGGTAPFTYAWNFGDGTTGSGQNVAHTYTSRGTYTVRLTVTNCNGASSAYIEQQVTVLCDAVSGAAFTWTPASPRAGAATRLSGTVGGGTVPVTYAWNFGDGTTGTGQIVMHAWSAAGTYDVTMVATNCGSDTSTVVHQVTVVAPMDTELRTPTLNLTGKTNAFLTFKTYFKRGGPSDTSDVDVSSDGGSTWTNVWRKTALYGPGTESIDISTWAANQANFKVRFRYYNGAASSYWQVDDVRIYGNEIFPDALTFNVLNTNSSTRTFNNDVVVNNNLTIGAGAMMEMLNHKILSIGGSYANNGTLSNYEIHPVTSSSGAQTYLDGLRNTSALLTYVSGNQPGDTTVVTRLGPTIPANAFGAGCLAQPLSVKRYYNVTAGVSSGLSVTLRLYYNDAELNGLDEATLYIQHCVGGSWTTEASTVDTTANYVEATVTSFSPFIMGGTPTAVDLIRFEAHPDSAGVRVEWETATERDNVGFNLYRSTSLNSLGELLNQELIPSRNPGGDQGASYLFLDETPPTGVTYYYTLEDIDVAGQRTLHGPVSMAWWRAYLPVVWK